MKIAANSKLELENLIAKLAKETGQELNDDIKDASAYWWDFVCRMYPDGKGEKE